MPVWHAHGESPEGEIVFQCLITDNLQILIPFVMKTVILDRVVVKRQEGERDL